jgi:F-box interacting protein
MGKDGEDTNDTVWSHQNKQQFSTSAAGTLILLSSSSYPLADDSLPFELIIEILWRLPVKLLMKLKCLCKSWNSLISSDRKFAMKHLRMSRMNPKLIINFKTHSFDSTRIVYPIRSFFTNGNGIIDSIDCDKSINIVGSCDGILCLFQQKNSSGKNFIPPSLSLWNPSTGKYNPLPYLDEPRLNNDDWFVDDYEPTETVYSFGYDHLIDKYKVVAVSMYGKHYWAENAYRTQVKVHTSGTNSWRLIQKFPPVTFYNNHLQSGIFVSGTINWLVSNGDQPIVSLDLGTESYQPILYPDQWQLLPWAF